MGFLPIGGGHAENAGSVSGTSGGTVVTASASANTKGSYSQLIASTLRPAGWIMVHLTSTNTTAEYLVDIAVGAAASEVVLLPNLGGWNRGSTLEAMGVYLFPCAIPAGTRISARAQCSAASSKTINVAVTLFPKTFDTDLASNWIVDYGTVTSTSKPTSVDPGGTANTKGAWVQLVASTSYPTRWINLVLGSLQVSVAAKELFLVDVGVGAGGSETVVVPDVSALMSDNLDAPAPSVMPMPLWIPQSSRIAVRCACSVNTTTERLLGVALYGAS